MADIAAVIFDWAGTMIDFGSCAPVIAMDDVFTAAGVTVEAAVIRRHMGMAKREHVIAILSEPEIAARWQAAAGSAWTPADVDRLMLTLEPAMQASATRHSQLIPGAAAAVAALRQQGVRVGSTTGYTRSMMAGILPAAAEQGYAPDVTICAGETALGRPAPLMLWQAMAQLQAWPAARCIAVDDAPVGITAGRNAGVWTIGVAASGNGVGLDAADWAAMASAQQAALLAPVIASFQAAGADLVIPSVADLALATNAIADAIAMGHSPGGGATLVLGCGVT
ncbi:MAG: phosphonoacetaldehyde hydrolase [Sandarakinorhabdus sp.]|jgi:phosphonoacetaldehyde hydrolase